MPNHCLNRGAAGEFRITSVLRAARPNKRELRARLLLRLLPSLAAGSILLGSFRAVNKLQSDKTNFVAVQAALSEVGLACDKGQKQ
jgi:hypothetical protein